MKNVGAYFRIFTVGFGDKRERTKPTLVADLSERRIIAISCGSEHSMAVDELGLVWGWGRNDSAQLGFHSLDEDERKKLSGKRLMIQRGNKPQRTLTLPMDNRIFLAKPTRISGMKAFVAQIKSSRFDESKLVFALRAFNGFFDVDDFISMCEKNKKLKLKSLLLLLKGRSEDAMQLLCDSLTDEEISDQQFCSALFSLVKEQISNSVDPVLKIRIFKPILRRFAIFPENAENQFRADKKFWYPLIARLLSVEPEYVPLSGDFKLEVLMEFSNEKSQVSKPNYVELNRLEASKIADGEDPNGGCIVFCSCKHVIPKNRLHTLLADRQIFAGRKLPVESLDVLRKCYDRGQIGLCPNCLLMDSDIFSLSDVSDESHYFGAMQ